MTSTSPFMVSLKGHPPLSITRIEHYQNGLPSRQLELQCQIQNPLASPICILDAWLEVKTPDGFLIAEGRLFYTLDNRIDPAIIHENGQGLGEIVIPLSPIALKHIEDRRGGGDFSIKVSSRVRVCQIYTQEQNQLLGAPFETQFVYNSNSGFEYTIPQSNWVKVLGIINWSELELIEMPSAKMTQSPQLSRAYHRFQDAQDFFRRGDWKETMASCRKAFEAIVKDTIGKDDLGESDAAYLKLISEPRKAKFISYTAKEFSGFLHLARHEPHPPIKITPKDAMLALHITGSLLVYLANSGA